MSKKTIDELKSSIETIVGENIDNPKLGDTINTLETQTLTIKDSVIKFHLSNFLNAYSAITNDFAKTSTNEEDKSNLIQFGKQAKKLGNLIEEFKPQNKTELNQVLSIVSKAMENMSHKLKSYQSPDDWRKMEATLSTDNAIDDILTKQLANVLNTEETKKLGNVFISKSQTKQESVSPKSSLFDKIKDGFNAVINCIKSIFSGSKKEQDVALTDATNKTIGVIDNIQEPSKELQEAKEFLKDQHIKHARYLEENSKALPEGSLEKTIVGIDKMNPKEIQEDYKKLVNEALPKSSKEKIPNKYVKSSKNDPNIGI